MEAEMKGLMKLKCLNNLPPKNSIMNKLSLILLLTIALQAFSQESDAKISKENKKRIIAELKAYMKNPQLYVEEQELQKNKIKSSNEEVELLKKQQSEHASLLVHLSDSIAALNNEKKQILESMQGNKVDSSQVSEVSEATGEDVAETIKETLPTKKIEPIKIEKPSAQVFEPIKIEKTTANAEAVKTPASPAKPVEPAKAAAPIAKAPEPAKPVVKAAEPNKIVVPTGRPGEPAKAAAPNAKPSEPNKIVVPTGRPEETAKAASPAPTKAAAPASTGSKTYKIQLGTFTSFNPSAFSGDKTLMAEKVEGSGANKLMIGNFTSEEEARKVAADFKKLGITGAFIVNYSNGVRVK